MSNETEPHLNLNARHNQSIHQQGSESTDNIPEPLYRLRVSVLKDGEGSKDCPIRMFTFPTYESLQAAVSSASTTFEGAFSEYTVAKEGVLEGPESQGVEDGRTEDFLIRFDSETADEGWVSFLARMDNLTKGWSEEGLGVKTLRGKGVTAFFD